ncbi:hypothetical protein C8D77_101259 [Mesorhizobium loti]|uniref:Uncharacterized protein n=1 Tax=Rhizobium loti TaxID=381 RepID=A0A8E2WIG4_RHILI|nr:hypothetical protein [Mesorhizobium loti]PWJ93580.1 hypothetical protein C8D77_101259 [Mesorhizobium loti]
MTDIKDTPENMLRAWADAGVISSARFVEEMERRNGRTTMTAPPLDYALDDELAISFLHHDDFPGLDLSDFDDDTIGPLLLPPPVKWIALIAATLIIVAVWMVLP